MADVYDSKKVGEVVEPVSVDEILRRSGEIKGRWCWGAYNVCPDKRFINEQDDEETVLLVRAHPITNLRWIVVVVLMLVFPFAISTFGITDAWPEKFVFMGKLFWLLVTMGIAFENFLNWYYSVFIVTNERIVDIDFYNLLYRHITYANLNHIEEPSATTGGLLRSLLKYGDVHVATAADDTGSSGPEAIAVPYPDKIIRIISELSEELEKKRERGE